MTAPNLGKREVRDMTHSGAGASMLATDFFRLPTSSSTPSHFRHLKTENRGPSSSFHVCQSLCRMLRDLLPARRLSHHAQHLPTSLVLPPRGNGITCWSETNVEYFLCISRRNRTSPSRQLRYEERNEPKTGHGLRCAPSLPTNSFHK